MENIPEFIKNIDWEELMTQKELLLKIINSKENSSKDNELLDGIVHLIDALQDYACDVAGIEGVIEVVVNYHSKNMRHAIYVKSLEMYMKEVSGDNTCGLCPVISTAVEKVSGYFNPRYITFDYLENDFPEFAAKKPHDAGRWWWKPDNTLARIKALNECIEETKP